MFSSSIIANTKINSYSEAIDAAEVFVYSDYRKSLEILNPIKEQLPTFSEPDKFAFHVIYALAHLSGEDMDAIINNFNQAKEIYKNSKIKNKKYLAAYYGLMGGYYGITEKDDPLIPLKKSLDLYVELNHEVGMLVLYSNISFHYIESSQFVWALDYAEKAYKISQGVKSPSLEAGTNEVLGIIYTFLEEDEYALRYRTKAMEIYKKIDFNEYYLIAKSAVAGSMINLKRYHQAETLLREVINDPETKKIDLYYAYQIIGESYYERGSYQEAVDAFESAKEYEDLVYTNSALIRTSIYKMGAYARLGKLEKAQEMMYELNNDSAFDDSTVHTTNRLKFEKEKSYIYEQTDEYKKALKHHKNYTKQWIEFKNKNSSTLVHDLKVKYATNQAENENLYLSHKNEMAQLKIKQTENNLNLYILIISLSFITILVIGLVLFFQMKFKKRLIRMVKFDALTQVHNRSYIIRKGEQLYRNDNKRRSINSVLLFDIDNFKSINDNYGHDIGDKALTEVARIANESVRSNDIFARFGGEEFVALLPYSTIDQAKDVAERIRNNIEKIDLSEYGIEKNITVSIGVASVSNQENDGFNKALIYADKAMYKAKKSGKNKVETI